MTEPEHVWRMLDGTEVTVPEWDGWDAALDLWPELHQFLQQETYRLPPGAADRLYELSECVESQGAVLPPLPRAFARLLNEERAGR